MDLNVVLAQLQNVETKEESLIEYRNKLIQLAEIVLQYLQALNGQIILSDDDKIT